MSMAPKGILVPLVTPFDAAGRVDLPTLERLAESCLARGAAGLVALGTTGEPATLSSAERDAVVETCAAVCAARGRPLLVGAGGNATAAAADEVERRSRVPGVTGVLSVVPPYTRPSQAGVVAHFEVLARRSAVPLVIYNIPVRTGRRLAASALLELATHPNVAGVKHSVGSVDEDTLELVRRAPAGFAVLGGDDALLLALLCLGAAGGVTASAHLCTRAFAEMAGAVTRGDLARARGIGAALADLVAALFAEPSPAVLKAVLAARGRLPTPATRLPLTPAGPAAAGRALAALDAAEAVVGG